MRLGVIITQSDPETVFNTKRFALFSQEKGDEVRIFLAGRDVEIDRIEDSKFHVGELAQKILDAGGPFLACGVCSKLRESKSSEICPLSTLKDHYEIVRDSDKLITI